MWTQNSTTAPTSWPQHCYQQPQSLEKQPANKRNKKNKVKHNNGNATGKPAQLVARRNARERRRVQAVNGAFARLRKVVPLENHRGKRVSKVKTLQKAIEYISQLRALLNVHDSQHMEMVAGEIVCLSQMLEDFTHSTSTSITCQNY